MAHPQLVFVLGLFQRCGTNHLRDLISYHPDCDKSAIPEDFLLAHSDHLQRYIEQTEGHWRVDVRLRPAIQSALHAFLVGQCTAARVLCKTPCIDGIENLDTLFPRARAIVIVRDGRDTLESGRRSFGWPLTQKAGEWAQSVQRLLRFERANPGRILRVHYEDLVRDRAAATRKILAHCGLGLQEYNWHLMASAPIRGSCELKAMGEAMNWAPMQPVDAFRPIGRHSAWGAKERAVFDSTAGDAQRALGYA